LTPTGRLAGDAWAETCARRGVWWARPEDVSAATLLDWAGALWLGAIVRAAGIRPGPDVRVLEAGCGTAQYALALALQGCRVDALDINVAALERATELAGKVGATRDVRLLEGHLLAMPTAGDAYDVGFNQQVMEYFVDERARAARFADMVRTTKPGGRVVVVVARPAHPFARWWRCSVGRASWISRTCSNSTMSGWLPNCVPQASSMSRPTASPRGEPCRSGLVGTTAGVRPAAPRPSSCAGSIEGRSRGRCGIASGCRRSLSAHGVTDRSPPAHDTWTGRADRCRRS
jgi:SAM-dependent methyltransferase